VTPYKVDRNNRQPNQQYAQATAAMREQLKQPNAVLIYFNDEDRLWYLPSIKELETNLPLEKIKNVSDGAIYGLKGAVFVAAR
jgi:hypothetical protein